MKRKNRLSKFVRKNFLKYEKQKQICIPTCYSYVSKNFRRYQMSIICKKINRVLSKWKYAIKSGNTEMSMNKGR